MSTVQSTRCWKVGHPSKREAEAVRAELLKQDKLSGRNYKVSVYLCSLCFAWHCGRSNTAGYSRSRRRL